MNIGIDIDGVLIDVEAYEMRVGKSYFKREPVDPSGLDVDAKFGVSKEEMHDFWQENYLDYIVNSKVRDGASSVISKLHEEGNKIYIITARKFRENYGLIDAEDLKKKTKDFLKRNHIFYDELLFYPNPKLDAIRDYKIDLMIEDTPLNITNISTISKVIAFDAKYNEDIEGSNIFHVKSWKEIYETIKDLKN